MIKVLCTITVAWALALSAVSLPAVDVESPLPAEDVESTDSSSVLPGEGGFPYRPCQDRTTLLCQPTTITHPGKYVVVDNITVTTGPVITIASDNVALELNGFTLTVEGDGPVIAGADLASLSVRSGTIASERGWGILIEGGMNVVIEEVSFRGPAPGGGGIKLDGAGRFIIRDNVMTGGFEEAISVSGNEGRIEGNLILSADRGIQVDGEGIAIVNNHVKGTVGSAILADGSGLRISGNTLTDIGSWGISGRLTGSTISDNRISMSIKGIQVVSDDGAAAQGGNKISGNVVERISGGLGAIRVNSAWNLVEDNVISGSGNIGLYFGDVSTENVYRGNVARGNDVDFFDGGTGNTSHGDNYMPGLM